ncbi:MAG TPA: hypothetical protein VFY36_05095 [Solirubrobacteraceae bacterium]|nr:hypothetical protein [Solirubrobacteraceae bacterium]
MPTKPQFDAGSADGGQHKCFVADASVPAPAPQTAELDEEQACKRSSPTPCIDQPRRERFTY